MKTRMVNSDLVGPQASVEVFGEEQNLYYERGNSALFPSVQTRSGAKPASIQSAPPTFLE
jgi:hypothetical protein